MTLEQTLNIVNDLFFSLRKKERKKNENILFYEQLINALSFLDCVVPIYVSIKAVILERYEVIFIL
jgi:hypothetical protein